MTTGPHISVRAGKLRVSDLHHLHFEVSGNPKGMPLLHLHGGPGTGLNGGIRRLIDPARFRLVMFDQRGCGRSTPRGETRDNTTWHLVEDIETLRRHLGVEKWLVSGGSWGSTLALTYAQTHRAHVAGLILRGIFLASERELDWIYQDTPGARSIFPEAWNSFVEGVPPAERDDILQAYQRRLNGMNTGDLPMLAQRWAQWEAALSHLTPSTTAVRRFSALDFATTMAKIECHYFVNRAFFPTDDYLMGGMWKLADLPGEIVHGRYDMICPAQTALALHLVWPSSRFTIVEAAGHSIEEPGIGEAFADALGRCESLL
nr:prolyl aminopeptidase [Sphingomonas sp. Y57]